MTSVAQYVQMFDNHACAFPFPSSCWVNKAGLTVVCSKLFLAGYCFEGGHSGRAGR